MTKLKDQDELEFEYKSSKDGKLIVLKITAPHEMNTLDFIWALEYLTELLQESEKHKMQFGAMEV